MRSQAEAAALPSLTLAAADAGVPGPFCGETARGAIYLAARYGLGVIVGVGNMLVMTWWIGPHAYGLFVTAVGIVAFLAIVARGGIDTYLVRSEAPDARMYGTATTLILGASIGLGTGRRSGHTVIHSLVWKQRVCSALPCAAAGDSGLRADRDPHGQAGARPGIPPDCGHRTRRSIAGTRWSPPRSPGGTPACGLR